MADINWLSGAGGAGGLGKSRGSNLISNSSRTKSIDFWDIEKKPKLGHVTLPSL